MTIEHISKSYLKKLTSLHVKKYRQKYQLFVVEGQKITSELLLNNPHIIESIIVRQELLGEFHHWTDKVHIQQADSITMAKISSLATPPPVIAVCRMDVFNQIEHQLKGSFDLYLDSVNDPGNAGTLLRTAEWFGIRKVWISPESIDLFHPKFIQSAMGSWFRVPFEVCTESNLPHLARPIIGAFLTGDNLEKIEKPSGGTIILGNESRGISPLVESLTDIKIKIQDAATSQAESLNVGIAGGILMHYFTSGLVTA